MYIDSGLFTVYAPGTKHVQQSPDNTSGIICDMEIGQTGSSGTPQPGQKFLVQRTLYKQLGCFREMLSGPLCHNLAVNSTTSWHASLRRWDES